MIIHKKDASVKVVWIILEGHSDFLKQTETVRFEPGNSEYVFQDV